MRSIAEVPSQPQAHRTQQDTASPCASFRTQGCLGIHTDTGKPVSIQRGNMVVVRVARPCCAFQKPYRLTTTALQTMMTYLGASSAGYCIPIL